MITEAMLRQLWPHGDAIIPGLINGIITAAPEVFPKYGLDDDLIIAHAMAQFSHECGTGLEMTENLNYSAYGLMQTWPTRFGEDRARELQHQPHAIADAVYNGRMGNKPGSDDGWNFRGRGLSQTTGRDGYTRLGLKVGLDLVNHPELVNDPIHALECGVADFVLCGCLPFAEADDLFNVTRQLNGGTIGLAQRKVWLSRWKLALQEN